MRKLLIVDDDKGIIELFSELFDSTNLYIIYTAPNAEDAFKILSKEEIEVILTDYHMPGKDGLWLMGEARKLLPNCQIVMMTGFASQALKLDSIKLGAMRFFEKPVNLANLLRYINELFVSGNKYTGNIKDISLIDIIQMLILTQESKLLAISIGEDEVNSEIYLQRGMITHASYFNESGEEAFKKIITSTNGDFQIRNYSAPPEQSIFTPSNNLLLSILVDKDEEELTEEIDFGLAEAKEIRTYTHSDSLKQLKSTREVKVFGIIDINKEELCGIYHFEDDAFLPENESSYTESVLNYIKERRIHRIFNQSKLQKEQMLKPEFITIKFSDHFLAISSDKKHIYFSISDKEISNNALTTIISSLSI